MYMTRWEPTTGDVYKLMRDPSNIKDSKAVAVVRGKSGEKETQQADDVHPNNMTDRFEVIGHVPALTLSAPSCSPLTSKIVWR